MKPLKLLLVLFLPLVGLTAALIVTPATDAAGQSTGLHTEFDDTDIEILAELVAALAKAHQQASLRASHQIEGGEAANVARALYNLSVAKARLAHAKGDLDGHLRHQHAAVVAAKDCAERTAIAYEIAQSVPLDLVIEAQIAYAKARLKLNDIKRSIANVTAVQEE